MIHGLVNANREAVIRVPLRSADGEEHEVEGVIDTGFNGLLMSILPKPPRLLACLCYTAASWKSRPLTAEQSPSEHCYKLAAYSVLRIYGGRHGAGKEGAFFLVRAANGALSWHSPRRNRVPGM